MSWRTIQKTAAEIDNSRRLPDLPDDFCVTARKETTMPSDSENSIIRFNLAKLMEFRRIDDQLLANQINIDRKTIANIRSGRTQPQRRTLDLLQEFFEVRLSDRLLSDDELGTPPGVAYPEYGSYIFSDYSYLKGHYFFVKKSFDYEDGLVISYVKIFNNGERDSFHFTEQIENVSRKGKKHPALFNGNVSIVKQTGVLQLISRHSGLRRLYTMKIEVENDIVTLLGVFLTLNKQTGVGYYPAATPIFATRLSSVPSEHTIRERIGSFHLNSVWDGSLVDKLCEVSSAYLATA